MTRNHTPADIRELLFLAAGAPRNNERLLRQVLDLLHEAPAAVVEQQGESALLVLVGAAWQSGWQPGELLRQGRLGATIAISEQLIRDAIAVDHSRRPPASFDPQWVAHVASLALPDLDSTDGWFGRWSARHRLDHRPAIAALLDALATLRPLPALDVLIDPPGANRSAGSTRRSAMNAPRRGDSNPMLDRIRNLLAKAESTTFEAEAMAFTAKAHELMTRHAIDAAIVSGATPDSDQPISVRLPIDPPYFKQKSSLLHAVAVAGRCRAISLPDVSMSTLVGFADDVAAAELLFTSLLVQAQRALTESASLAPGGSRARSRSYRASFLAGFTHRIAGRLREINEAVYAQAEVQQGSAFLPVLRSRAETIDDYISERFGSLTRLRPRRQYDWAGWSGGTIAAENARLSSGVLNRS